MNKNLNELHCWFNGKNAKLGDVRVSITDFGFIHCDATYDVFRCKDGTLLHFNLHERRFHESCEYFGFEPLEELEKIAGHLLHLNGLKDAFVWACVWRGTPLSGNPRDLSGPQHSLVYTKPYYPLSTSENLKLCIEMEHRRVPSICYDQKYKNFGWVELTLAQRKALAKGFDSALVLNIDGFVSEGPGFSVCFVRKNEVVSPKTDCLGSVTVQVVEKICSENNIRFSYRDISADEAYSSDEAFLCSTSGGITLVNQIDSTLYKHELSAEIKEHYDAYLS